ncbi:GDP-mannose 4,6-dehydratase [Candidatus Woesebacteria bacterium]|nr:GDP-mannose 4,6-dehydratase [Candidatus Woesebacteria bacterium]
MSEHGPILVTGGSGFAGSHLLEHLITAGGSGLHATRFGTKEPLSPLVEAAVQFHSIDLTDQNAVVTLIQQLRPTAVYHLAAFSFVGQSFQKGSSVLFNNIQLQINLLEAIKEFSPETRILVIGSAEEYGLSEPEEIPIQESHPLRPVNPYAVSKIAQDLLAYSYAVSYDLDIVRVRPFNHIGERQTSDFAVPAFAEQIVAIERGSLRELRVGDLSGVRDFTAVEDMAAAYSIVMQHGKKGEVYNIGSGRGVSMQEIVDLLISYAQVPIKVVVDPTRFRPLDIPTIIANNERIRSLGWEPTISLETSLQKVLNYWRNRV